MPPSKFFPPVDEADPDGLIGFGGKLTPEWLLDAYRHAIFPWPVGDRDEPMAWWSPDPRAIFELDGFHISRRLGRTIRGGKFQATFDRDFAGVIGGCATADGRVGHTWLTPKMIAAYTKMHRLGWAHSVETWLGDRLVGGTYGLAIGGLFAAESMFYRESDASKVALAALVRRLRERGFLLLDTQMTTPHTESLGAIEIPRDEYLRRLAVALEADATFGESRLEA